MLSSEISPEDRFEPRRGPLPIALTPRQRAVYDRLWLLTGEGQHDWTGTLNVPEIGRHPAEAAARSLRDKGAVHWQAIGNSRRYVVLVPPARLIGKHQPASSGSSKLKDAPPVGRDWSSTKAGVPRSFSVDAEQSHYGVRKDDGSFSTAFSTAFRDRDYGGLKGAGA